MGIAFTFGLILAAAYLAYLAITWAVETTFKIIGSAIGAIVLTITWVWFVIGAIVWGVLLTFVLASTALAILIVCVLWPRKRALIVLLSSFCRNEAVFFRALRTSVNRKSLELQRGEFTDFDLGMDDVDEATRTVLELKYRLAADPTYEHSSEILLAYLNAMIALEDKVDRLIVNSSYLDGQDFLVLSPNRALPFNSKINSTHDYAGAPFSAIGFLFKYLFCVPVWAVFDPFRYAPFAAIQSFKALEVSAAQLTNRRILKMKNVLSLNRKAIEQVIRDFDKFLQDQRSVHQQTVSVRDEMVAELNSLRAMAEKYHNEAARLREYVNLVRARSDEMDRHDPLSEMKALVQELKGSDTKTAANG